jgi:hypothetical protein
VCQKEVNYKVTLESNISKSKWPLVTAKSLLLNTLHGLINVFYVINVNRHNKAVWEIRKLLISSEKSRCFILMNAGTFNNTPQENTVPNWLLPCTCSTQRCHCNSRFRPDILCVRGLPYQNDPPTDIDPNLTIQLIEFTYCNDRFSPETLETKSRKYRPLIDSIVARGWKVDPLIIITFLIGHRKKFTYLQLTKINYKNCNS